MLIREFKEILAPPRNTVLCKHLQGIVFLREPAKEQCQKTDILGVPREGIVKVFYGCSPCRMLRCWLSAR
jgi:hypothetical protein